MKPVPEHRQLLPEQFAILPWGWTSADPRVLAGIRECGFNLAGFVRPGDLNLVAAAGLKAIVFEESTHVSDAAASLDEAEVAQRISLLAEKVKGHPALFGYYLRDEPAAQAFPGLRRWVSALQEVDPAASAYINLFPNYATNNQLGADSYEEYVNRFLQTVSPPFLSYDHYALMENGNLRDSYFANLEVIRSAAQRQGIPFWNIVLANAHFTYAEPTPAGLRFQAYTTLAYGARGISYFTYFTPDRGNYRLGPIDPFGEKTPTWDMLRQVNHQIHHLGPTYLQLNNIHVFHNPDVPPGCAGLETSAFLDELSGGSFVVGEFQDGAENPYILIVNKDMWNSAPFHFRFKQPGRVFRTSPYSGQSAPIEGEDNWLAPGQGVLLGLASQ